MRKILVVALAVICLGCTSLDVRKSLEDVESYIMERPDSALAVLDSMDRSLLSSDRTRAHHALLYAMALDKNFIDVSDDSIARVAVDYYSRRGSDRHHARSLYYLGIAYFYQGAYDKSILELTKAEEVARECDSLYWGMTKSFQAKVYDCTYNNKEEQKCLLEAYRIYNGINDNYKSQFVSLRLAMSYSSAFCYENSERMYLELIDSQNVDSLVRAYALSGLAFMNVARDQSDIALKIYEDLITEGSKVITEQDYWAYAYALCVSGRDQEADDLVLDLNKETTSALYWQYRICDERGQYEKALRFLEESNFNDNKIIEKTLNHSLSLTQRNYYEAQYELAGYKAKNRTKTAVLVIIISALLVCIILWSASVRIKHQREEKEMYLQYANEISRQLDASKKDNYPSLKKKYLDLYKTRFETIGSLYEQYSLSFGKNNAEHLIYERVVTMVDEFRKEFSDTAEFEAMLDADLDNIMTHLRNEVPKLKQADVTMFCFMALGFDVTTISHLMNVSMNTVYIRRSRLRQKIELTCPEHLDLFLHFF